MPTAKEITLDQLFAWLVEQFFKDPAIAEAPEGERSALVAAKFNAMAKAEAERQITGVKTELSELQEAFSELQQRVMRKESFRVQEMGFHRGVDGRLQPNVSRETADTLGKLVRAMQQKKFEEARAVSSGVGAEGGYLLSEETADEILRLIPETGVYASIARPWPIGVSKVNIGSVLSQMGAYWPEENQAITPTYPSFGKVTLDPKLLGALIPIPLSLLEDVANFGQLCADLVRECIAEEIDRVAIAGKSAANGGTDPFDGLINAAGINAKVMDNGHTHISDLNGDYLLDMQTTIPKGQARKDASYLLNTTVFDSVRKIKTSTGDYVTAHFVTLPTGNQPGTIWGRPYYLTDQLPDYSKAATPSKRFGLYGNFKKWAIFGNRKELTIATSDVAGDAFKNVQLLIRGITRVAFASFGEALAEIQTAAN